MSLELNQLLLKRLVWLYLISCFLIIAVAFYEVFDPLWRDFDHAFYATVDNYFDISETPDEWMIVTIIGIALHLIGSVALVFFKNWARFLFIWLFPLLLASNAILFPSVYYLSAATSVLQFIASALFGLIVALLISKDHGALWFSKSNAQLTA